MNGNDTIERFNAELDGLLSGAGGAAASADPAALEFARKLAGADFSAESKIQRSLRARLLEKLPVSGADKPAKPFSFGFGTFLQAALAAACLLLIALPLTRRDTPRRAEVPPRPAPRVPAAAAAAMPAAPPPAAPAAHAEPAGPGGLFHSVPMAALSGGREQEFPIKTTKGEFPITLREGRKTGGPNEAAVTWETENAVFILERRIITADELFERKAI
ncbi:MAG TPA: hypothetical protein PKI19_05410 [Elusimicrobiales bacterium]|nr:hypothetical protein [Elusimicrobiales bacterium]